MTESEENIGTESSEPSESLSETSESKSSGTISEPTAEKGDLALGKMDKKTVITVGMMTGDARTEADIKKSNAMKKLIEEKLNIVIEWEWQLPWAEHDKQVMLSVATNRLPDVVLMRDPQLVKQCALNDKLKDLTDCQKYFGEHMKASYASVPNNAALKSMTFNNRLYGIPACALSGQEPYLWIREDWLENLDLDAPVTVDDVFNVAKAFIQDDPDGNGKKDTIGLPLNTWTLSTSGNNGFANVAPIFAAYNAFPGVFYKNSAGKVIYGSIQPEVKTALAKIKAQVKAGTIITSTTGQNEIASGTCGMIFGPWWAACSASGWVSASRQNDKFARWICVPAPLNSQKKYMVADVLPGKGIGIVINKNCAAPEAAIKVLNLYWDAFQLGLDKYSDFVKRYDQIIGSDKLRPSSGTSGIECQIEPIDKLKKTYFDMVSYIKNGVPSNASSKKKENIKNFISYYNQFQKDQSKLSIEGWRSVMQMVGSEPLASSSVSYFSQVYDKSFMDSDLKETYEMLNSLCAQKYRGIVLDDNANIDLFDAFVAEWKSKGGNKLLEAAAKFAK